MIRGMEKLRKQKTKVSIAEAKIAGEMSGSVTFRKSVKPRAPRVIAISS